MWADFSSILSQFTRLTDGRTDRFVMTRPPAVKTAQNKEHLVRTFITRTNTKILLRDKPQLFAGKFNVIYQ